MSDDRPPLPPFPAVRAWLGLTALMAVALLFTVAMLGGLGRTGQLAAASASGGVCYLAAMIALEPVRRAGRDRIERVLAAALATMGIRFGGTLLGVGLLMLTGLVDPVPTAGWTLGWYLLLLVAEVAILVRYLRQGPPASPRFPSNP